jgi:hypothetical protein
MQIKIDEFQAIGKDDELMKVEFMYDSDACKSFAKFSDNSDSYFVDWMSRVNGSINRNLGRGSLPKNIFIKVSKDDDTGQNSCQTYVNSTDADVQFFVLEDGSMFFNHEGGYFPVAISDTKRKQILDILKEGVYLDK